MRKQIITLTVAAALTGSVPAWSQNTYATSDLSVGDTITIEEKTYLVGPNLVTNGSFDDDPSENSNYITGWTMGNYASMTTTYFNWYSSGGYDDGAYISSTGNYSSSSAGSIGQRWSIDTDSKYYFTFWISGLTGANQYVPVVSITNVSSSAGGQNEYAEAAAENGGTATMLLGANGDSDQEPIGYANYNEDGSWCNTSIYFDSEECTYLQFNARWLIGADSYGFDGFGLYKLYDPETTTRYDLLIVMAYGLQEDAYDVLDELEAENAYMYAEELLDLCDALDDVETEEEAEAYIEQLEAAIAEGNTLLSLLSTLTDLITVAEHYAEWGYPGIEDYEAVLLAASDYADNGYGDLASFNECVATLEEAINTYLFSQSFSAEDPADYSFLISAPYFTTDVAMPYITYMDSNSGISSIEYPNVGDYTSGTAPGDAEQGDWYIGTSGGDQRLNYFCSRVCWNAWRTGDFTLTLGQDLTSLPSGYYTVSAEMITQSGCLTDQHLFADGTTSVVSANLTSDDAENATWEWLTTDKVLVLDGTLTIGASSGQLYDEDGELAYPDGWTDYRGGWFCVTNFRLLYYGEADAADVLAYYEEVLAEATALVDSVYYAADKTALAATVAAQTGLTAEDDLAAAIATLKEAMTEAQSSIDKYTAVSEGTLLDLQTYIAEGDYSENQAAIAGQAVDLMLALEAADDASYVDMDDYTEILRYYRDTYLPLLAEAEAMTVKDATAAAALAATIAEQVAELSAVEELPSTDDLAAYVDELQNAIDIATAQDILSSGSDDLTELITNPTIEADSNTEIPEGWTASYVNGDKYSITGQSYDGTSTNRYLDSWNTTAGLLRYTAYQTLSPLPNGTYELAAKMRATGTVGSEGIYLFAIDGADTIDTSNAVFAPAHIQATDSFYVDNTLERGQAYGYFTGSYGPIWSAAFDVVETGGGTDDEVAIADANGGIGWGWFNISLQITISSRSLTLGVTCDSTFTSGLTDAEGNPCVPFSGTWFSADDFTLTLVENLDTDFNLASGITQTQVTTLPSEADGVFTLDGRRLTGLEGAPAGIYIVRTNGQTLKVLHK